MAYLISIGAGTSDDVFPAKRSGGKTAPCTIVWSKQGSPQGNYSGTFDVQTSIIVRTLAPADAGVTESQPRLDSDDRVGKTFDAFHMDVDSAADKLGEDITAAARALAAANPTEHGDLAEYTAIDVAIKNVAAGFEENSEAWNDTLDIVVTCCPSNVS